MYLFIYVFDYDLNIHDQLANILAHSKRIIFSLRKEVKIYVDYHVLDMKYNKQFISSFNVTKHFKK